jgi:hypothetical protein
MLPVPKEIPMTSILNFVSKKFTFDDQATAIMGEAFDAACAALPIEGQPEIVREVIAKRIIKAAEKGERDPGRLRDAALSALGRESVAQQP